MSYYSRSASAPLDSAHGLPHPRRLWAVLSVSLAVVLSVLDGSLANVALPTIASELHASAHASVWVVNGYQLAIITTLLPVAALAEHIGYRRVFRTGILIFTLSSAGCAWAHSLSGLVAARVIQGLGASAIMCCSSALLRLAYPSERFGKGLALNTFVVTLASAAGPTICAAMLSFTTWPWLYAINLPIGLLALLTARQLPFSPLQPRTFDALNILLNAFGMSAGVVGITLLNSTPWIAIILIIIAILSMRQLVMRSRIQETPLLPLDLFRIPRFRWAVSASFCMFSAQMCAFVTLPFYVQHELGLSIVHTGLLMTTWPVGASLANLAISPFIDRLRAASMSASGAILQTGGLVLLLMFHHGASDLRIAACMLLSGIGFGLFQAPNGRDMLSAAPRVRSGAAGGMQATARVSGQTCGAALAGLCFSLSIWQGSRLALGVAAGLSVIAVILNLNRRRALKE
ncbi:MFS transporter [Erwinia amylovora]